MFGASSIGALRAAEMGGFGLTGVGAIYRAYSRGTLVGDDEVALVHTSSEWDWRPLSLPLVDVRATSCRMRAREAIGAGEARALLDAAADIHYVDRTWRRIVEEDAIWAREPVISETRSEGRACGIRRRQRRSS